MTQTIAQGLGSPSYFAVGAGITYYYYESGNPSTAGSWGTTSGPGLGTPAPNFTTLGSVFVIESGYTATLTGNLTLGTGTNAVTLTVQNGATLNTQTFSVIFAGNGSVFNLQNGATFMTQNANGINGTANNSGAVQITAGTPASVSLNYGTAVNFSFNAVTGSIITRHGSVGNKPAITQVADLTINPGAGNTWVISSPITVNNVLTVQSGTFNLAALCTVNGLGSTIQNGSELLIFGGQLSIGNPGALTIQNGGSVQIFSTATNPAVITNYLNYAPGSRLYYGATSARATGLELPSPMDGNIDLFSTGQITLSAPLVLNGTFDITSN